MNRIDSFFYSTHIEKTRKLPANVWISLKSAGPGQPGSVIVTTSFRICPVGIGIIKWGSAAHLIHLLDPGPREGDHEQGGFNANLAPARLQLKVLFFYFRDIIKVRELLHRPLCANLTGRGGVRSFPSPPPPASLVQNPASRNNHVGRGAFEEAGEADPGRAS